MSRFSESFLAELKDRVKVSDVVGKRVKLKRQGREWAGLSPFVKERTPSFFVNDDKGFFHCFASGEHGDVIEWLTKTERMTFVEAVEHLAAQAGLDLPRADPRAAEAEQRRKGLADWLEAAAAWFENRLRFGAEAAGARAELQRRGLPPEVWARFRLGYAPDDRSGLKDTLVAAGAKIGDLVEAGLLIAPEDGGAPFDRFRDRIMFPICDARGRVVSFGGRAMNPAVKAKYLNGPETPVFHKGRTLYGLHLARQILGEAGGVEPLVVAVEGYMDVIACQRAGVAAVAGMGTALTPDQLGLLWRLSPYPTLCFDGDRAGRAAAGRAMEAALSLVGVGKTLRLAVVRGGKDPDDVFRDHGADALRAMLGESKPLARALFERERDAGDLTTPEGRAAIMARLRQHAAAVRDRDLSHAYRGAFFDWRAELNPARAMGRVAASRASPEAVQAAMALRGACDDVVEKILAMPADQVGQREAALFDLHDQLGAVQARMDELRGVIGNAAQMAEFAALKGRRDHLKRTIKAGGVEVTA